jgi:hypothetical protein
MKKFGLGARWNKREKWGIYSPTNELMKVNWSAASSDTFLATLISVARSSQRHFFWAATLLLGRFYHLQKGGLQHHFYDQIINFQALIIYSMV